MRLHDVSLWLVARRREARDAEAIIGQTCG